MAVPNAGRGSRRPVLVLLEGLDCSGKSTIIGVVGARLRAAGYAVREIEGGTLAPDWINRIFLWACRDRPYEVLRRLTYRSCVLVDRLTFSGRGWDIILQHSYVHRQLAFEMVTGSRLAQAWSRAMARIAVRHDVRVLLTVDMAERIRRYQRRGPRRTERKDRRFGTPEGLAYLRAMETTLHGLVAGEAFVIIDTTEQTVEETAAAVLSEIDRWRSRSQAALTTR